MPQNNNNTLFLTHDLIENYENLEQRFLQNKKQLVFLINEDEELLKLTRMLLRNFSLYSLDEISLLATAINNVRFLLNSSGSPFNLRCDDNYDYTTSKNDLYEKCEEIIKFFNSDTTLKEEVKTLFLKDIESVDNRSKHKIFLILKSLMNQYYLRHKNMPFKKYISLCCAYFKDTKKHNVDFNIDTSFPFEVVVPSNEHKSKLKSKWYIY